MALFFSSSLDSSLCSRGERRQGQQLCVALPCILESRRHSVLTPDLCQPREKSKAVDVVLEDPRTQEKVNTGAFSPSGPKDKPTREQGRRRCGNGATSGPPTPTGRPRALPTDERCLGQHPGPDVPPAVGTWLTHRCTVGRGLREQLLKPGYLWDPHCSLGTVRSPSPPGGPLSPRPKVGDHALKVH